MSFVIVADANLDLANFAAETLGAAGFESRGADAQNEALAISVERRTDLVLTDYYLAVGDGLGLISALKERSPDTAVVMVTSLGDETLARAALTLGALDYVIKGRDYYANLPALATSLLEKATLSKASLEREVQRCRLMAQMELASWLDHNFKNILSAVIGSLALIDFNNPNQSLDKRREYLNDGQESLKTAVKLLDSLTAMAKVVDNDGERTGQNVLVSAVVDEAFAKATASARENNFPAVEALLAKTVFQNNSRWLPPLRVGYHDLLTVLEALLINALEAVAQTPSPLIMVGVEKVSDSQLRFTVKDNGRGMDDKVLRHAFEPLFSTKGEVGVGLSLTTARALVIRHNGEISLNSSLGQGTSVVFTYHVGV
ncbi:MAG: hybrid sensor histidine kinase/response regulator [Deltaproteobacteria bacterium]|nr:hybrid sensor histidine kinase/response regulator [Deltaproteobacteria bacterium]